MVVIPRFKPPGACREQGAVKKSDSKASGDKFTTRIKAASTLPEWAADPKEEKAAATNGDDSTAAISISKAEKKRRKKERKEKEQNGDGQRRGAGGEAEQAAAPASAEQQAATPKKQWRVNSRFAASFYEIMAARQLISQKAPLHSDAEVTISVAPGAAAVAGEAKRNPTMNRRQARAAADHQSTPPRQLKEKDRGGAGSHSGSSGAESQTQNSLVAPRSAKRDNNLHPLTQRTRPSDVAAAAGEREPTVLAHSPSPSKPGTTGSARKAGGGDRERPSSRAQNDQESRSRFAPRDEGKRVFSSGFAPRPGVEGTGSTSSGGNAGSAGGRESSSHATKDGEGAKLMKRFNKNVELGTGKAGIAGQLPTGDQRGGKVFFTTSNAGSATGLDQTKSGVRASSSQGGRRRGLKKEDDPPQYIQSEPEHSSKDASESADVSEQSPSIGSNVTYTGVRIPPTNLSFHQPLVQQQYLQQHRDRVGQTPPSATTPAGQMQIPAGYTPYTAGSPMFAYSPISASAQSPFGLMSRQFGAVGAGRAGAADAAADEDAAADAGGGGAAEPIEWNREDDFFFYLFHGGAPAGASGQGGFPQAISQQGAPQEQGATLQTHTMSMGQQLDNIPDLVCIDFDDCLACAHLYRDNPSPAEWAKSNFGSAERTGPVSEALSAVGLLECFDKVFGSDVPPFESSKAQRMERMLRDVRMMHPDAAGTAVLIDDSVGNCRDAAMAGFSTICQRHITCEALIRVLNGQYD
eukprot:g9411.t1